MAFLRALPTLLLAGCLLALTACSTPPPPRVTARTVYKINTALLITSDDGKLSAEQLQAKREEVVRYLSERGLLTPDDVLVENAAADRIIRVSIAAGGGFKVTIFNPGSIGATYAAAPTIGGDVRVRVGADDYWPTYDPWFDQGYYYSPYPAPGYYRYQPRDYVRPYYPRDYFHPGEPRRHPPPPPTVSDPTPQPQPRPRLPGGFHNNHPTDRDERRPDWRDRHSPRGPDNHPRGDDSQPRPAPTPPPPVIDPPRNTPEPRPAPEPRHAPERARDDDRRDWPQPAK